jgi:hypothetical protein
MATQFTVSENEKEDGTSRSSGGLILLGTRYLGATSLLAGLAAALVSLVLDYFLLRTERWAPMGASLISNVLFGTLVTVLVFKLLQHQQQRQEQVLQRLETINEMNHHIRNALQVISFNVKPTLVNKDDLAEINQAVNRIQWALREILPKLEPRFTPFEGSARQQQDNQERPPQSK